MRKTLLFSLLFLFVYSVQAQFNRCATYESLQEFRSNNPSAGTDAQFEAWIGEKIAERRSGNFRTTANYTIPVIFHIIHDGETSGSGRNLDMAKIQQQLNQLNADYANLSGSTYGVAANSQIQFCLATVDANGVPLAEPGINRVNRTTAGFAAPPYAGQASNSYVDVTIMPSTIWDPNKFLNIWTLELSGSLLGKATFPTNSGLPGLSSGETNTHAGVFVDYRSVGSICSPGSYGNVAGLGRTLTHEIGHWLGLRHITGDATCGDDYAGDTPPQDALTSGCPGTGAANNCPSTPGPKMFENYMDYTDDRCVNTFTADQVARMQAVMANADRRVTLAGAGSCAGATSNAISFNYVCATVPETRTVTSCPQYRDVLVNINVQSAATGAATITFVKSGTATDNVDYTVIPSSLTYTAGESAPKTVTIRIWDDGMPEVNESLFLTYTISGTGVVAGTSNTMFSLTITDDDVTPVISNTGSMTIFTETWDVTPIGAWTLGNFAGHGDVNEWIISSNGGTGFTGRVAHITNDENAAPATYTFSSPGNTLLVSPQIDGLGKKSLKLSFKYKSVGEINNFTPFDYGTIMYSLDGNNFFTLRNASNAIIYLYNNANVVSLSNIALPASLENTKFYIGFRWQNDNNSLGGNPPLIIDDIVVSAAATGTEGELTHSGTKNILATQNEFIMSANDNQAILRIANPSTNIGCVTATIAQAGTGTAPITSNKGSFTRTQKVINVVPATPNQTVTYQATFYFSAAELAIWGADRTKLKILQVQDGVNLSGMITSANAKVVVPTAVNEDVANGVITYTATFTGFSQFMLVSPTFILPVNLMTFEAKPAKKSIELTWSTASERNNKGFHIERSTNGADFTAIGWVNGAGTTSDVSNYKFTDNNVQSNTQYYYRLNQVDLDNQSTLSEIRQAKISESSLIVTVSPNPASDQIKVLVSGSREPVNISLVNAKGQTVGKWSKANVSAPYPINISRYAKGYYTLVLHLPEGDVTEQVIIQ